MGYNSTCSKQHRCHCVDDLLAPLRSKMKVLKKFKRRMGLVPRSSSGSTGTNNLPPLLFHQVHGENIRVSRDGSVARRAESFCKGVTFTNRPVKISEKVYVKFLEVSNNWSGVIRFGFTCNDPSNLRYALPKYACPDLTNKAGYWAKALAERFCERDTVLFYYVTNAGDVHFGINGEEKGIFFSGIETRGQLWAMIDVYGNSTAIELLDARRQMNNSRRNVPNCTNDNNSPDTVDRLIIPSVAALSIHPSSQPRIEEHQEPPPPRFQQSGVHFSPLPFHRTRGRSVRLSNDRCIASRLDTEFCQGYVFTSRPVQLGERIVIQVLAIEPMYIGALALGLTSCDPATLQPNDLPDDSDLLLDRPEYWVVSKDVASYPQRGDELAFCITIAGEVQMSKNGNPPTTLMHVDQSLVLWAFLDIYGSTQKIRILGSSSIESRTGNMSPSPPVSLSSRPESRSLRVSLPETRCCPSAEVVQLGNTVAGGTVLVVNLPPPASTNPTPAPASSGTLLSTYSHTYIEPVSATTSYSTLETPGVREWAETSVTAPAGSECSICYERAIDSVLYMCGHMCMCYDCAVQQWRGKGGGHCPLCRAVIRDVIRTYKS